MKIEEAIIQKKFKNKSERLVVNLIYTANCIEANMHEWLKPYGISQPQYNVLRILRGQHPLACNLNLIQQRMLDKMSNASRLVDKLFEKEFVTRETSCTDRRQVNLKITQKGLAVLAAIDLDMQNLEALTHNLTGNEQDDLNELLNKLRN